jgi:hypothetical protein
MSQRTAALALSALQVIETSLANGVTVNANALTAVNAGLFGLLISGMEPTDAQQAAVAQAIGNLTVPDPVANPAPVAQAIGNLTVPDPVANPAPVEAAPVEAAPVEAAPVEAAPQVADAP